MMFRVDKVISRRLLIESLSGFDREIEENTLDTFVHLLPNKVDTPGKSKFIHTGPGAGYLIREDGQV
jgi:DNA-binding response OmpR family regulator